MDKPLLRSSFRYREEDPDFKGDRLDDKYGDGPEEKRGCTDVFCCLLFLVFLGGLGYVASIAFTTGRPEYLVYPFDSAGSQCGYTSGYESYPYIYITSYNLKLEFVCVASCPNVDGAILDCKMNPAFPFAQCSDLITTYATTTVVTYCLPVDQATKMASQYVTDILSVGFLQTYFADFYVAWQLVAGMVGVSFVVSIIYSILIRYFAGFMVWLMILLLLALNLVLGLATAMLSQDVQFVKDIVNYDNLPEPFKDKTYEIVVSCLCLTLFCVGFLIVCCMKKQIPIGIIKAAADFVRNCCAAFLIPFYITILQVIFLGFWIVVILFLFSSNTGTIDQYMGTPFGMVVWNQQNQKLIIFYVFGLLWVINFFSGLQTFWVSSTAAIWYFQQGEPSAPVLRSICRSFYHLGSIAFGSLLIALVMFVRIVLQFINQQLKQKTMGISQGKAVNILIKCSACLIACFERIIRFITENAYIMMAISGQNFCNSAKQSFYLMLRSTAQFFISHGTTKLFINFGTALIITMCCTIGYFFITNISPYKEQIQSPVFMTILFAIVSLPIAWAFMEFFEKGANTILMCYCVELDLAKKKSKCPAGLKNFLQQYVQSSSRISQQ